MKQIFKIGTRDSLLAVTQSTLIKNELEQKTGAKFELVKIKTEGDLKTDKPLWQLDGKDFFTKELDQKLLAKEVDLVIHSYKDLGSIRPEGIHLSCVTKRFYPNDILLIKKETIKKLKSMKEINIGTSSPRRIHHIENNLIHYLPNVSGTIKVQTKMLRGNVNTRIQKLKDDQYDAIVLAHAGLERLALHPHSKPILEELLSGLNFLLLPQKDFPSCASQGALAIETHIDNKQVQELLKSVHCQDTFNDIKTEREIFQSFGGGCHLAVGIHVKTVLGKKIVITKGEHNEQKINKLEIVNQAQFEAMNVHAPSENELFIKYNYINNQAPEGNLFVTSRHCFHNLDKNSNSFYFSAGNRTAKKLVKKGFWVNGSAEGFGHQQMNRLKESVALNIMLNQKDWFVLSHDQAESVIGDVHSCYSRYLDKNYKLDLDADGFYWTSFYQYKVYSDHFPQIKSKKHFCGLGKTYEKLSQEKIQLDVFADMRSFNQYRGHHE